MSTRFPIKIIEFDELEFIIFVSQGLTPSTASLVYILYENLSFPWIVVVVVHEAVDNVTHE